MKFLLACIMVFFISHAHSKDLGVVGQTFSILEIDMLDWIQQRLRYLQESGQMKEMQALFQEQAKKRIMRPEPVKGLTTTTQPNAFYVDPTLELQRDIIDSQGRVLYKKGLRINPFDTSTWGMNAKASLPNFLFKKHLIFLNADDVRQIRWLQEQINQIKDYKIILTDGSPFLLNKQLFSGNGRVYFDQHGALTRKLQIKHIPSIVRQHKKQWHIQEFDISTYNGEKL